MVRPDRTRGAVARLGLCVLAVGLIAAFPVATIGAEPPDETNPGKAIEFLGIKDKTAIAFRDTAAYVALLKRARETRPSDLAARARRDVGVRELWDHPEDYRGVPFEVRGIALRASTSESKLTTSGRLSEVWIKVPQSETVPFACVAETLPEGLPIGPVVSEPVVFRGFFLKLIAYQAGEVWRGAPLLIGTLERDAGPHPVDAPLEEQSARFLPGLDHRLTVSTSQDDFTLRVDRAGLLTLEDKPIVRKDLAKALAGLAERVRLNAQAGGIPLDSRGGLPAIIAIEADDETPCGKVLQLGTDWHASGFRQFILRSTRPDDVADPAEDGAVAPARKESGLPAGVRTIPIELRAGDLGQIGPVQVGEIPLRGFEALKAEITSILNDPDLPFDRAVIILDPGLRYSELRRVVNLLVSLNVTKVSFDWVDVL